MCFYHCTLTTICEILTFDWLDDVIWFTAPYITSFTMTGFTQRLCNNNIFVLFGIIKYLLTGYSGDSKFTISLPWVRSYLTSRGNNKLAILLNFSQSNGTRTLYQKGQWQPCIMSTCGSKISAKMFWWQSVRLFQEVHAYMHCFRNNTSNIHVSIS